MTKKKQAAAQQSDPVKKKFSDDEMKTLLTDVFGPGFVEYPQGYVPPRSSSSKKGPWSLYYTGETAYINADVPRAYVAEFVQAVRSSIYASVWQNNKDGTRYTPEMVRDTNGQIDQCIGSGVIDLSALYSLHARGIKNPYPSDLPIKTLLTREDDWVAYKTFISKRVNQLIFGHDQGFHVRGGRSGEDFNLLFDVAQGPVGLERYPEFSDKRDQSQFISAWDVQRFYNNYAHELGVAPFILYESYHVGGHGAIDEERIIIPFRSAEDMALKLSRLENDHEFRAQLQKFVGRVMQDVCAARVMEFHLLDIVAEVQQICPARDLNTEEEKKAFFAARKAAFHQVTQRPENVIYDELRDKAQYVSERSYTKGMTVSDLLQELRNPPADASDMKRRVYAECLQKIETLYPMLARDDRAPSPVLPPPTIG